MHVPSEMKRSFYQDILPHVCHKNNENKTIVLLAGISGGCDSVALFHALQDIRLQDMNDVDNQCNDWKWTMLLPTNNQTVTFLLHVIHFDHQQRGESSSADRGLVEDLCRQYNVPCTSILWNDDYSQDDNNNHFSQEKARHWRRSHMRRHLKRLVEDVRTDVNVTGFMVSAHHLDDSNETLLLKLIRGSHLTKLIGMTAFVPDEMEDNLYWTRPLLGISKSQLIAYLQENGHGWREDESNEKDIYLRNRVRNELVPLMKDLMGGDIAFQKRIDSMEAQSQKLRWDLSTRAASYLTEHTDRDTACPSRTVFCIPKEGKLDLVFEEALHSWVSSQAIAPNGYCSDYQFTYEQFQRLLGQITEYPLRRKWSLNIGGGWNVQREGDILRIVEPSLLSGIPEYQTLETTSTLPEEVEPGSFYVHVQVPTELATAGRCVFICSTSANYNCLEITPPWRQGRNPLNLKEFLRGQKVPLHLRGGAPVILLDNGSDCHSILVAVFVDTKGEWMLDSKFFPRIPSDDDQGISWIRMWLRIPRPIPT